MENDKYSNPRAIAQIAIPAIVLNAAAPLTSVVQTSLLGIYAGTDALGAFGAVCIVAGFATRVFNFFVDGVSAKTGKIVGLKAWDKLASAVKLALCSALFAGILAGIILALIKDPISQYILALTPDVMAQAEGYWWIRVSLVPISLANMATSGTLQGFRHVKLAALINSVAGLFEMAGSALVLKYRVVGGTPLLDMGFVTLIAQCLALLAGLSCILFCPPPEAQGKFNLWKRWFGDEQNEQEHGLRVVLSEPLLSQHNEVSPSINTTRVASHKIRDFDIESVTSTQFGSVLSQGATEQLILVPNSPRAIPEGTESDDDSDRALSVDVDDDYSTDGEGNNNANTNARRRMLERSSSSSRNEDFWGFIRDGIHMFVRSMILQTTFFIGLVAASRLGTDALAAHSIISQLWTLISYAVDGFAAAGIVLGSRLAAQAHDPTRAADAKFHLQRLIRSVVFAGLVAGVLTTCVFWVGEDWICGLFTNSPQVKRLLESGLWWVLTVAQPINSMVFVYDGLMYSSGHFEYIRNYMLIGFVLVFCPMLAVQLVYVKELWFIWMAMATFSGWRLLGAMYLIHILFMQEFDAQLIPDGRDASAVMNGDTTGV